MKLSNETLTLLKNYASINNGLEFKKGNKLVTISPGKAIFAVATIKETFPQDFCVYDLNQFLSVHSLFKDTELDFDTSNIIFKSGRSETNYRKAARESIVTPPDREVKLPSVDIEFTLTEEVYNTIMKTANILSCPHIAVESEGDKIYITAFNAADDSAHTNSTEVADGNGQKFKMVFLTENLKMISGTYDVQISFQKISSFKNKNADIHYWIAVESKYSKSGD